MASTAAKELQGLLINKPQYQRGVLHAVPRHSAMLEN